MPKWKGKKDRITKGPAHVRYNSASFRRPVPLMEKQYCTAYAANGMRDVFNDILPHPERLKAADPELYKKKVVEASQAALAWFKAYGSRNRKRH